MAAALAAIMLTGAGLPDTPPLPTDKPDVSGPQNPPETPVATPRPKPSPDTPASGETPTAQERDKAEPDEPKDTAAPTPEPKPESTTDAEKPKEPVVSAIVAEDPVKLESCLRDLKALGAEFEPQEPIKDDDGVCGIERPILMTKALPGVPMSDPSPMRCEAALALSHWLKDTVQPTLALALPDRTLTGVRNAPGYTCRKRNGAETGKISEHARGNAIDIIGLDLSKGEPVIMTPKMEDPTLTGAFQRTITAGACLHFTTVLSPGSDATHQDHLHLDVLERNGGYRYCR
ncbi:extensin family protein [Affinirhizobium pseudoryzae]|uniref:extensin family protein n=1 Tax=Allorhizobium pseudoryzae TaxID=379684 RepID=UPI0013EBD33F|nr:extensin family protein [Allorhizobium pseudoryzae]